MIQKIKITNSLGRELTLSLTDPYASGLIVTNIEGLTPASATINTTDLASGWSYYNSARVSSRNIVLTLRFLANPTVEAMRLLTYQYFAVQKQIRLEVTTDARTAYIDGYVESNEPVIFSSESQTAISIICPFPYFQTHDKTSTIFVSSEPTFTFPFSNDSLTEPLLQFGAISAQTEQIVDYQGDVSAGFYATLTLSGGVTNPYLYNDTTKERFEIDSDRVYSLTGSYLTSGDVIYISTVKTEKRAELVRGESTYSLLPCLATGSKWVELVQGENVLSYNADGGASNAMCVIESGIYYEGV